MKINKLLLHEFARWHADVPKFQGSDTRVHTPKKTGGFLG